MSIPKGARIQPDGSITFPARGNPPVCDVPGYEEDPTDAYRWIRTYNKCVHRLLKVPYICSSGKQRVMDKCALIQLQVNPLYCTEHCPYSNAVKEGKECP